MAKSPRTTLADKVKQKRIIKKRKPMTIGEKYQLQEKVRSGLEAKGLGVLQKHGIDYEYEPKDKRLSYVVPEKSRTYLPDVIIDGIIYEFKGLWELSERSKMLYVIEQNPTKRIVMVFQRDNPISKGSKTRYSNWCDKHGIEYMMMSEFEQQMVLRHKRGLGKVS